MTRRVCMAAVAALAVVWSALVGASSQSTTNDGVYSKAQADAAKPLFDKLCADCHAFTVAAKKKADDLPLGDEPFLKTWEGKTVDALVSVIVLTMPNDGSAVIDEDQALNLMAYVLQQNGYPAGDAPLTKARASATLVRPKTSRP